MGIVLSHERREPARSLDRDGTIVAVDEKEVAVSDSPPARQLDLLRMVKGEALHRGCRQASYLWGAGGTAHGHAPFCSCST